MDVLGTKLHLPIARGQLVPRPRLTLVSAPPGFGKTTMLNEPRRFLTHLVAALRRSSPEASTLLQVRDLG